MEDQLVEEADIPLNFKIRSTASELLAAVSPLFLVPTQVKSQNCSALIDSGATEDFISTRLVTRLQLPTHPLTNPIHVRAANGSILSVDKFVRLRIKLGKFQLRINFRVVGMLSELVLGMPFLRK